MRKLIALTLLLVPAAASADTTVHPDPLAEQVTALDGKLVWVTGAPGRQTLAGAATGPTARSTSAATRTASSS